MENHTFTIWGRSFELEIRYDIRPGETLLPNQKEAAEQFIKKADILERSLPELKKYCAENSDGIVEVQDIDNIFKYVVPAYVFVVRDEEHRTVALICHYKFDPEHGLAMLFENEELKEIGEEDIAF